jgi:2-phospho-L-lactate guanylyltransferase
MTAWSVIVPVKPWGLAKSRLTLPEELRYEVARAMTLDTLEALTAASLVGSVLVVSADSEVRSAAVSLDARAINDEPFASVDGLSAAVRLGRARLAKEHPSAPVAVVPTDLPGLTSATFDALLKELGTSKRQHVVDMHGTGTTILVAPGPLALVPAFGIGSAQAHSTLGSYARPDVDERLRRDVDTLDDWQAFIAGRAPIGRHLRETGASALPHSSTNAEAKYAWR